jgi:hypothetical protein
MAARHRAYTHRHDEAQPADQHSDDPVQAQARMRRAKEAARCRHREHATLAVDDERTGLANSDQQGEVA